MLSVLGSPASSSSREEYEYGSCSSTPMSERSGTLGIAKANCTSGMGDAMRLGEGVRSGGDAVSVVRTADEDEEVDELVIGLRSASVASGT